MSDLKPYKILEYENTNLLSAGIYDYLIKHTNVSTNRVVGWIFLDTRDLLKHVPELLVFFSKYKLYVRDSAITIVIDDSNLPLHMDTLPVIAKINIPVINTQGWSNQWFEINSDVLANINYVQDRFGNRVEDLSNITDSDLTLLDEVKDMEHPMVFNSRIPHRVVNYNAKELPRIVASFTFHNEPLDLLK